MKPSGNSIATALGRQLKYFAGGLAALCAISLLGPTALIALGSEIDFAKARESWAFKPPKAVPAPVVTDPKWPRSEIDRFVLAALEAKSLKPVGDADRHALLRRVYFDLNGMPPKPDEVLAFVNDRSPEAFEEVVDRLLVSPQFGERWARHWFDVARYAESTGKERNFTYPNAWRYRDYVIDAFNEDKPYDEFIREQIAGDLLPARNGAQRNEHLIATGFLAIGPKGLNERKREQFVMDIVDEQIDVTSRAVLGLTVSCARCHDHKFDPIPTRDYYAIAGIFRSSETFYGTQGQQNRQPSTLLTLLTGSAAATDENFAAAVLSPARALNKLSPRPNQQRPGAAKKQQRRQAAPALVAASSGPASDAVTEHAMGVLDGRASDCPIFIRGEIDHRGEIVPRGFLTVLTTSQPPKIDPSQSGRLELANWLMSRDNPLPARVMANRVWQHLFGQGLVRTPDNFGAMGEKPSHPELLDYLASRFMDDHWSVKALIRSIVLSRVYQLSSADDKKNYAADPDNVLLWRTRPRRLDAESIRDAVLAASGQLDLTPPHGSVVAQVGDGYIGKGIKPRAFNADTNKRSVYLPIVRDLVPDILGLFDFAEPSLVVASRDVTTVPSQALFMMNSPFVSIQSEQMAKHLLELKDLDSAHRISLAYLRILSRPPNESEQTRAEDYLQQRAKGWPVTEGPTMVGTEAAWATLCQALFACAEFRYLR